MLGDKVVVNGKIEPVLRVARRKYRFRLLNAGPSRFYEFYLQNSGSQQRLPFTHIANDGNLLPNPLRNQFRVRLAPAERADIVVDFSRSRWAPSSTSSTSCVQTDTRRPGDVQAPGTRLLKFIVDRNPPAPDQSVVPSVLRPLRPLPSAAELAALPVRSWNFERSERHVGRQRPVLQRLHAARHDPQGQRRDLGARQPGQRLAAPDPRALRGRPHPQQDRSTASPSPIPLHERGRKDVFILGET